MPARTAVRAGFSLAGDAAIAAAVTAPSFRHQLDSLGAACRLRRLAPRAGADFSSNDYLALAGDPVLAAAVAEAAARGVPVGSGGSRLLRGNHPEHEALEATAAAHFGTEAALFFATGFAANQALFSTLPQKGDLVVADSLVHASAHEGLRLGRSEHVFAAHNDASAFADAIARWRKGGGRGRVWIAFETLYSMDGDLAPLAEIAALAEAEDAWLLVDEAHAGGVFGKQGRGLADGLDRSRTIALHTLGKAYGAEGALVAAPDEIVQFLINRARPFIFSTAPSPLIAVAASAALDRVAAADDRRERLEALRRHAADRLCARFGLPSPASQIIPIVLGDDGRVMAAAAALARAGFDIRGIRPPTVPEGSARLRISLTLNIGSEDIDSLAEALEGLLR